MILKDRSYAVNSVSLRQPHDYIYPIEDAFFSYINIAFGQFSTLRNLDWYKVLNHIKYVKFCVSMSKKTVVPFGFISNTLRIHTDVF